MKYDLLSRFPVGLPTNDRAIALIIEVLDMADLSVCLVLLWKLSIAKLLPTPPGSSRVSTGSVRQEPAVTGTPVKTSIVLLTVKPAASRRFTVSPALNIKKNKKRIVVEEEATVAVTSEISAMLSNTALQSHWHLLRMTIALVANDNATYCECNGTYCECQWHLLRMQWHLSDEVMKVKHERYFSSPHQATLYAQIQSIIGWIQLGADPKVDFLTDIPATGICSRNKNQLFNLLSQPHNKYSPLAGL